MSTIEEGDRSHTVDRSVDGLQPDLFERMVRASSDGMLAIDPDGLILFANEAAAELLGRPTQELLGAQFGLPLATDEPAEIELITRARHLRVAELRVAPSPDGIRVAMLRDVSQRVRLRNELQRLALADTLTGVGNRRAFLALGEQALKQAEREGRGCAVLFVDIDHMKQINDRYGHRAGDRAVVATARMLTDTVRESDIVARVGGDEFCVLLSGPGGPEALEEGIARVRESAAGIASRVDFPLSVTVGATWFDPADPVDIGQLMDTADAAMYEAKRQKRERRTVLSIGDGAMATTLGQVLGTAVQVVAEPTTERGLQSLRGDGPDLVVLDADLPELAITLDLTRKLPSLAHVPVVVWRHGDHGTADEEAAFAAGADEVVVDDAEPAVLRARLTRLFSR